MKPPFIVIEPKGETVPILLSVPHCGTEFPDELRDQYVQEMIEHPDDTDWYVDKLYDFASSMGITIIRSVYSRWVIDLNRDPESKPLYTDGRIITGLCPVTDFLGRNLYLDNRKGVVQSEISRRLKHYYWPYHDELRLLLRKLKSDQGKVLLWDCHSIRQNVPTIQQENFPDLILGDADGTSASEELIVLALKNLTVNNYTLNHNHPFKGGHITRAYGKPAENTHALQLEMTKVNYMDDAQVAYNAERAEAMRTVLKKALGDLSAAISV